MTDRQRDVPHSGFDEESVRIPRTAEEPPHIMLVVGEPSGDALGAQLMESLRMLTRGHVRFSGVGGSAMEALGIESLFDISDTSVMGLREVVPAIPRVLARVRQVADYAEYTRPDVIVLIDAPDFTHRVARRLVKRAPNLKVVKYVAPQVWASRPKRAARLAEMFDCVLTLLPFEPAWFEPEGIMARFVGHPVVERQALVKGGVAFRERHDIGETTPLLVMLPGSRSNEVRILLPYFREAVRVLSTRSPKLETVIPVVSHVSRKVAELTQAWPTRLHLVGQDEKFAAFDAGDIALATSGTVTTEVALAELPMVVAYRMGWLSARIVRNMVIVPFATLINIIEGRGVIPEFLQEAVDPDMLADELELLLTNPQVREQQLQGQMSALRRMGLGGESPSTRAARAVLEMLDAPLSAAKLERGAGIKAPATVAR